MANGNTYTTINAMRCTALAGLYVVLAAALLAIGGCFKEKPLQPPKNQGIGRTNLIELGPNYTQQVWYNITDNKVISTNNRFEYDLLFDCSANSFYIWLNTADFATAIKTGKTDLNTVTVQDTVGKTWFYEFGAFEKDSNAIGPWWDSLDINPHSAGQVYIINLGVDTNGNPMGNYKLKVDSFANGNYYISYAELGSSTIATLVVPKDPTRNYRYVKLSNQRGIVEGIEPDKATWDICFTHYTIVFYEPYYLPYQVTGALINPAKVQAYVDSTIDFNTATIADLNAGKLQSKRDAIGYEWKTYTVSGLYDTKRYYIYFIKAGENEYYKFHFLDFNKDGAKGYPAFEYYGL